LNQLLNPIDEEHHRKLSQAEPSHASTPATAAHQQQLYYG
jgi:hypothetical protein